MVFPDPLEKGRGSICTRTSSSDLTSRLALVRTTESRLTLKTAAAPPSACHQLRRIVGGTAGSGQAKRLAGRCRICRIARAGPTARHASSAELQERIGAFRHESGPTGLPYCLHRQTHPAGRTLARPSQTDGRTLTRRRAPGQRAHDVRGWDNWSTRDTSSTVLLWLLERGRGERWERSLRARPS